MTTTKNGATAVTMAPRGEGADDEARATLSIPSRAPGRYAQIPHDWRRALESCRGGAAWAVAARLAALCYGVDAYLWDRCGVPVDAAAWGAALGYHRTSVARALRVLESAGVVERTYAGRWRCVAAPVDHAPRRQVAKNCDDLKPICASTHVPTIKEETETPDSNSKGKQGNDNGVSNEQQPDTTEYPQQSYNAPPPDPEPQRYRHRQAVKWFAFDRYAPVGRRKTPLTEICAAWADALAPGWHDRPYRPILADRVSEEIGKQARFRTIRGSSWSAAAVAWALRCVAEDRRAGVPDSAMIDRPLEQPSATTTSAAGSSAAPSARDTARRRCGRRLFEIADRIWIKWALSGTFGEFDIRFVVAAVRRRIPLDASTRPLQQFQRRIRKCGDLPAVSRQRR